MKAWTLLGYLGLIPLLTPLLVTELYPSDLFGDMKNTFHFYSASILCFLSGTLWKVDHKVDYKNRQLASNLFCLYGFMCLLIPLYYALFFLLAGYIGFFIVECIACRKETKRFTDEYKAMRIILTVAVCLLHLLAFILWF